MCAIVQCHEASLRTCERTYSGFQFRSSALSVRSATVSRKFECRSMCNVCLRAACVIMSAEPGRKRAYSDDIKWRVVYQRIGMQKSFSRIAASLNRRRVNTIAAMSSNEILGVECKYGSVDGDVFFDFLRGTLIPQMQPFPSPNSVIIMDNC